MLRACVLALVIAAGCGATGHRAARPEVPLAPEAYARYLRGRLAVIAGDYPAAARHFRAAAELEPAEAHLAVAWIDAVYRSGRRVDARDLLGDAEARWPDDPEVWLLSGQVHRGTGRSRQAQRAFARAVALDSSRAEAHLGLASAWVSLGDPGRAEAAYRAMLEALPDSLDGLQGLARLRLARRAFAEAEPDLRRVVAIDPDDAGASLDWARALRGLARHPESIAALAEAFDRTADARVGAQLFHQLLEAGELDEARALLARMNDWRASAEPAAGAALGALHLELGDAAGALAIAEAIVAEHPGDDEGLLLAARALGAAGRRDDAIARALEVGPEQPAYAAARVEAARRLLEAPSPDLERALALVEEARVVRPRRADLMVARAEVIAAAGDVARARAILEAALEAHTDDVTLLAGLAALEDDAGDADRAVALMERVLSVDPDNVGALNFIGYALAERGRDLDRAAELLAAAIELAPGDPLVLDSRGWLEHRRGAHAAAARTLARAVQLAPKEPEIIWHLGEVRLALGQRKKALALFERAASLGPPAAIAQRLEGRIRALSADK